MGNYINAIPSTCIILKTDRWVAPDPRNVRWGAAREKYFVFVDAKGDSNSLGISEEGEVRVLSYLLGRYARVVHVELLPIVELELCVYYSVEVDPESRNSVTNALIWSLLNDEVLRGADQ